MIGFLIIALVAVSPRIPPLHLHPPIFIHIPPLFTLSLSNYLHIMFINHNGDGSFPVDEGLSQHLGSAWFDIEIDGADEGVLEDDLIVQKS